MLLLFFLIIDLYFLITAVIAQIFNPTTELAMPIGTPTKEVKEEIKTHPVTAEAKISKAALTYQFILVYFLIKSFLIPSIFFTLNC